MEIALKNAGLIVEHDFGNGNLFFIPIRGIDIIHLGSVVIEEPQANENGVLIKDGVLDNRWHTNIRTQNELTSDQKQLLPILDPPPTTPKVLIG